MNGTPSPPISFGWPSAHSPAALARAFSRRVASAAAPSSRASPGSAGINSVISAATIEAVNSGWEVIGILDGFEHLIQGSTAHVLPLSITDVSRIHALGGSILYTARANPTVRDEGADDPDWRMHNCLKALRELGIELLVTIGGDDTAFSASRLAEAARGAIRVAPVPT